MKRYIPLLLIISLVTTPLCAESAWEGTSTMSRYGEFPDSGNYGASNSFPRNTVIKVKNLENGKETTVIIVDRLEDSGIFLLVSKDAAEELGISSGEISRVRTTVFRSDTAVGAFPDDLPLSPDPDINPAAGASAYLGDESAFPEDTAVAETTVVTPERETEIAEAAPPGDETAEVTEETRDAAEEDLGPRINGVETPETPSEETAPDRTDEEPTPPLDTVDRVAVSELADADAGLDEEPRLAVGAPPEPPVEQDSVPFVLDILPAPVLDDTEAFVLLAEPDVPSVEAVAQPEEGEEADEVRITAIDDAAPGTEDRLEPIALPEPAFEERLADTEEPVAEDILIVSGLEAPVEGEALAYAIPNIADEPEVIEHVAEEDALTVVALDTAEAVAAEDLPAVADLPTVLEPETAEGDGARVTLLDEPADPGIEELAAVSEDEPAVEQARLTLVDEPRAGEVDELALAAVDEPDYTSAPGRPEPVEDTLVVSGLESAPSVENGEEIAFLLEPAEPRPPQGRIVDAAVAVEPVATGEEAVAPAEEPPVEREAAAPAVVRLDEYSTALAGGSFYLQLGVFSEAGGARRLQDNLADTYPVTVYLTESADRPMYKVLVGPLNQDESGALLYQFRKRGYPDAFVRKGAVN
jgi:hypothetical protein